jgi:hypothetical protein
MTTFDIEENQGVWFDINGGGRVQLKILSYVEWKEIAKATITKGPPEYPLLKTDEKSPAKHIRFQPEIINNDLQIEMTWDKTIISWEGLMDKNQKPIPCTKEWKIRLMFMDDSSFRDFYNEKMKILMDAKVEQDEKLRKNLPPSQSGDFA